ncbi:MAG: glycosyltransferase [Bacteroidia bacterium]|nr:glycosyltransferase [Bacteroidia bacterium]
MKISVITVCYNSAKTLGDTLQSVVSQDHDNKEYIVVDGGSSDQSLQIIQSFGTKINRFVSEKDNGLYDALNKGIGLATGEVISILHSDDRFAHGHVLSDVADAFNKNNCESLYGDLDYMDGSMQKVVRKWRSGPYNRSRFLSGWMPPHPAFFLKRSAYENFGTFNTAFTISADYELMLRMLYKNKVSSFHLPAVLVKMRVGGKSNVSIRNRVNANQEDRKAWEVNGIQPRWYTLTIKPLRKLGQFF